jgi:hypothetical protein
LKPEYRSFSNNGAEFAKSKTGKFWMAVFGMNFPQDYPSRKIVLGIVFVYCFQSNNQQKDQN